MTGWRRGVLIAGGTALYAGVLLTGMALPLWPATAIGLAAFLSYTALMRPKAQWAQNPLMVCLTVLVLGLLALGVVALGATLSRWARPPDYLGPVLAFGGVLVARLAWSARKSADMDAFLDGAITELTEIAGSFPDQPYTEPGAPALSADTARRIDALPGQLEALPPASEDPAARARQLDELIAPLRDDWSAVLQHLVQANQPEFTEPAAWLMLSPGILPATFGMYETFILDVALTELAPEVSEMVAARALTVDLDESECWRILPVAQVLEARAANLGHPPALTALADFLARRDAEAIASAG